MIRIRLPAGETQRLDQAFRQETDPKYRDRIQIVRLASRGRPHQDIAQDLAITPRTVQRWLNAYLRTGSRRPAPAQGQGRHPARSPPPWPTRSAAGSSTGRPSRVSTAPTGPTRNWPTTCSRPTASSHAAVGHAALLPARSASASTAPPTASCVATRRNRAQAKQDIAELKEKAKAGELVLLSQDEARFPMVPTRQATLGVKGHRPDGGYVGLQGPAVRLRRGQPAQRRRPQQHAGEPQGRQEEDGQEQDAAGCKRRSPSTCGMSAGSTRKDKHKEVVLLIDNAPWHAGKPVNEALGGEPALEVQASAQLQPAAQPDRAVLEDAEAAGDAQPAVRQPGGPQGLAAQQPLLLPDHAGRVKTLLNGRKKTHANRTAS